MLNPMLAAFQPLFSNPSKLQINRLLDALLQRFPYALCSYDLTRVHHACLLHPEYLLEEAVGAPMGDKLTANPDRPGLEEDRLEFPDPPVTRGEHSGYLAAFESLFVVEKEPRTCALASLLERPLSLVSALQPDDPDLAHSFCNEIIQSYTGNLVASLPLIWMGSLRETAAAIEPGEVILELDAAFRRVAKAHYGRNWSRRWIKANCQSLVSTFKSIKLERKKNTGGIDKLEIYLRASFLEDRLLCSVTDELTSNLLKGCQPDADVTKRQEQSVIWTWPLADYLLSRMEEIPVSSKQLAALLMRAAGHFNQMAESAHILAGWSVPTNSIRWISTERVKGEDILRLRDQAMEIAKEGEA